MPQSEATGSFLATFLALLHLMKEQHYFTLLGRLKEAGKLHTFVRDMLNVFKELVNREGQVFPADWLTMYLLQSELLQRSFEFMSLALFHYFSGASYRAELWELSFLLSVDFACQKHLQVEGYDAAKRQKAWCTSNVFCSQCTAGDRQARPTRQDGAASQRHVGQSAKGGEAGLYPQAARSVPQVLAAAGRADPQGWRARRQFVFITHGQAIMEIFVDMMVCEVEATGSLQQMEAIFFDKLDEFISDGRGDMDYRDLFDAELASRCQSHTNLVIRASGPEFLANVSRLIYLLVCLRNVPDVEEHRDERAGCLFDMLSFYESLDRPEMYVQYVHKLAHVHAATHSYLEAAFTLILHASQLNWSDELSPYPHVGVTATTQQTQREQKIQLYSQIIDHFDKGQAWEPALQFCKELAEQVRTFR